MKTVFVCAVALCVFFSGAIPAKDVEIPGYVVKAIANPSRSTSNGREAR